MATRQLGASAQASNDTITIGEVSPKHAGVMKLPSKYRTGYNTFCSSFGSTISNAVFQNNTVYVCNWVVTAPITVGYLYLGQIAAQGTPNTCILRMGVWQHDSTTGKPGKLIVEPGSFSGGAGNGGTVNYAVNPQMACNFSLSPGMYWVGFAIQGASTTPPVAYAVHLSSQRSWDQPLGSTLPTGGAGFGSFYQSNVTGALGDFNATGCTNVSPKIGFRPV